MTQMTSTTLPGKCILINSFMGENLYEKINKEVVFQDIVRMGVFSPSILSNQCDIVNGVYPLYRHPIDIEPVVHSWSPTILSIRNKILENLNTSFNHCLIRKYRNGDDHIREHSDKILDIKPGSCIVNYSCGTSRIIYFRHKITRQVTKIELLPDSLFIMDYQTNIDYFHAIKKQSIIKEPRISCTFRMIDTFKHPDKKVTGQGSMFQDFINEEILEEYTKQNKT